MHGVGRWRLGQIATIDLSLEAIDRVVEQGLILRDEWLDALVNACPTRVGQKP